MKMIGKVFVRGLLTALPIALTIAALVWMFMLAETALGKLMKLALGEWYVPGMGVAAGVVLIFALGVLMHLWIFRKVWQWGESLFARLPLVKTIYGGIRDFTDFLSKSGDDEEGADQVCVVSFGEDRNLIGLVTRDECGDLPDKLASEGFVAVYLPMSYQIGGFTFFMPREQITPLKLTVEEGMRLALTAGVSATRPETVKGGEAEESAPGGTGKDAGTGGDGRSDAGGTRNA
jgi:uncharacterized membrane protein